MTQFQDLTRLSKQLRLDVLQMIKHAGSGHLAGSLGMADVFAYFYHQVLNHRPQEPQWSDRDYFLLSAGHICPVWYATLARFNYFDPQLLSTLRQLNSPLQGHPKRNPDLGIENTSGPLGQGISMAAGLAYGLQQAGKKNQVFVVSSDGEQQEGQVWEAYLFVTHYHLKNLTIIIDCNGIQASGRVSQVMSIADLKDKLLAFNFAVGVVDGHDFANIDEVWQSLVSVEHPKVLLCQTTPAKGISFMENDHYWHSKIPDNQQYQQALTELEGS